MKHLANIFKGDRAIWMLFMVFSLVSLVAVFSSIGLYAITNNASTPTHIFMKHLVFVLVSWVVAIGLSNIPYKNYARLSQIGYWICLALLVIVLAIGKEGRWLQVPILGRFQPSEVAKVVLVIYLARVIALDRKNIKESAVYIRLLLIIGLIVGPIMLKNLSTGILLAATCFLSMLVAGVNKKWLLLTVVIVGLLGGIVIASQNKLQDTALERTSTWSHRIDSWLHPDPDELTQENIAKMAIASGGLTGNGVGHTIHARLMTQAHNDFIYAIIIEEVGSILGFALFLLYSLFFYRAMRVTRLCKGTFGAHIALGLGLLIYLQAVVNMCVSVGVLPVTGQTLPMVSFGGTAYLCMGASIGILQSVARTIEKKEKKERTKI